MLKSYSFDTTSEKSSAEAIKACSEPFGKCPDAVFMCAGASRPGFFVEQDEASMRAGMEYTFYAQAFTALVCCAFPGKFIMSVLMRGRQAAGKAMVKDGVKGKLVFFSSVLGYFSIVGYSTYSPGKFALRGTSSRSAPAPPCHAIPIR